jgi:mannose-6-phosphate isomerase-like protein (cupin superfamily)
MSAHSGAQSDPRSPMTDTRTSVPPTDERAQKAGDPDLGKQHIARVVRYETPVTTRSRHVVSFGRTDSMMVFMQILLDAGESSLHMHPNTDSFWWVVRGKAEFYTTDHELLAALGPEEGVMIPREYPYLFNSVGEEPLEILQIESFLRQGERLQTVHLEEDRVGDYELSQVGEYASPPPPAPGPRP